MNKLLAGLISILLIFVISSSVLAQQSDNDQIPEKNGDYPDPLHPGLRVHVFVHEPGKPGSQASLVCEDPASGSVVPPAGWHLPFSVTYKLNTSSVPASVGSANLAAIAGSAFTKWASASAGLVTFTSGGTTSASRQALDGQNIISWGRTSGSALAVTYTRYYTSSGEVADVDTIFNLKFPWSWNGGNVNSCPTNNAYDAQDILTHETGHWMGLDDTYSAIFVNNTMYGYGATNEVKKDTLTSGDISGVKAIYP